MFYLILFLTFLSSLLAYYGVITFFTFRAKLVNRLDKYIHADQARYSQDHAFLRSFIKTLAFSGRGIGNLAIFCRYKKNIQDKLIKAHIPLKGEEFITLCIVISLVFLAVFTVLSRSIFNGMICAAAGWFLPSIFVRIRYKKRLKLLNNQIGDAITLISNSLKAGYSFFQAIDTLSTEMSGSIAEEFTQVKKEINLGLTTEHALDNLIKRVDSDDLELVVTAILIQRQVGGNLAEILDNISETIRERIRIKGEVRTITAQGRMSGFIIAIIPPAIGVVLSVINPKHIALLFSNTLGLTMVGVSVVMELIGILIINKIVKIEV